MCSYFEQDGTFVNVDGVAQRIHVALRPFGGRKNGVELAAFLAQALGAGTDWPLGSWTTAFQALKKRTGLLEGLEPLSIGALGASLDALERRVEAKAGAETQTSPAQAG